MPSFKTADGREWLIRLDAPKIQEIRTEVNVDLGSLDFASAYQRLADDPVLLYRVLWILCREQAQSAYNINAEVFGQQLTGDAWDSAAAALIQARADFSPARTRTAILKMQETSERIRAKAQQMIANRLDDPKLEERILNAIEAKMNMESEIALTRLESVANSPGSAASTHAV